MRKVILIFSLVLLMISCKKSDSSSCSYNSTGDGRYVFAPDSAMIDSTIRITLTWENMTACQKSKGFQATINGNVREVVYNTKVDTCNCDNSEFGLNLVDYTFSVHQSGQQIVKTQVKPGIFHTDTIVIY